VPVDLSRYVIGPTPYSSGWTWLAVLLAVILVAWYAGVFFFTRPGRSLRDLPLIGGARDKLARRRLTRTLHAIGDGYRSGELSGAAAGAAASRVVRGFLQDVTGVRAEYMQLDDIADGELASAAPLLTQLNDAQFNPDSRVEVGEAIGSAEELIRSWP
jgi:hypothetical protein